MLYSLQVLDPAVSQVEKQDVKITLLDYEVITSCRQQYGGKTSKMTPCVIFKVDLISEINRGFKKNLIFVKRVKYKIYTFCIGISVLLDLYFWQDTFHEKNWNFITWIIMSDSLQYIFRLWLATCTKRLLATATITDNA